MARFMVRTTVDRRDDKRYLKEQKRAWKADLKSQRRYEKDALRYSPESRRRLANVNYDNNYYGDQTDNNYGYDDQHKLEGADTSRRDS